MEIGQRFLTKGTNIIGKEEVANFKKKSYLKKIIVLHI
jgi:hypothetical protein